MVATFSSSAAHAAVSGRAAAAKADCRAEPGSPLINVKVSFKPDGTVAGVQVSGAQGASDHRAFCVQRHFWSARVPPFHGPSSAVTTVVAF